jgi:hypothetical protein
MRFVRPRIFLRAILLVVKFEFEAIIGWTVRRPAKPTIMIQQKYSLDTFVQAVLSVTCARWL